MLIKYTLIICVVKIVYISCAHFESSQREKRTPQTWQHQAQSSQQNGNANGQRRELSTSKTNPDIVAYTVEVSNEYEIADVLKSVFNIPVTNYSSVQYITSSDERRNSNFDKAMSGQYDMNSSLNNKDPSYQQESPSDIYRFDHRRNHDNGRPPPLPPDYINQDYNRPPPPQHDNYGRPPPPPQHDYERTPPPPYKPPPPPHDERPERPIDNREEYRRRTYEQLYYEGRGLNYYHRPPPSSYYTSHPPPHGDHHPPPPPHGPPPFHTPSHDEHLYDHTPPPPHGPPPFHTPSHDEHSYDHPPPPPHRPPPFHTPSHDEHSYDHPPPPPHGPPPFHIPSHDEHSYDHPPPPPHGPPPFHTPSHDEHSYDHPPPPPHGPPPFHTPSHDEHSYDHPPPPPHGPPPYDHGPPPAHGPPPFGHPHHQHSPPSPPSQNAYNRYDSQFQYQPLERPTKNIFTSSQINSHDVNLNQSDIQKLSTDDSEDIDYKIDIRFNNETNNPNSSILQHGKKPAGIPLTNTNNASENETQSPILLSPFLFQFMPVKPED